MSQALVHIGNNEFNVATDEGLKQIAEIAGSSLGAGELEYRKSSNSLREVLQAIGPVLAVREFADHSGKIIVGPRGDLFINAAINAAWAARHGKDAPKKLSNDGYLQTLQSELKRILSAYALTTGDYITVDQVEKGHKAKNILGYLNDATSYPILRTRAGKVIKAAVDAEIIKPRAGGPGRQRTITEQRLESIKDAINYAAASQCFTIMEACVLQASSLVSGSAAQDVRGIGNDAIARMQERIAKTKSLPAATSRTVPDVEPVRAKTSAKKSGKRGLAVA